MMPHFEKAILKTIVDTSSSALGFRGAPSITWGFNAMTSEKIAGSL